VSSLRSQDRKSSSEKRSSPNPFKINTYTAPASVDSKPLTGNLSPLDATYKKQGVLKSNGGVDMEQR
jgi:hypothetical protein